MHQFGWLSERGGNFLNLLQKEGGTQKGGGGGVPSEKGEFLQPWRKLWISWKDHCFQTVEVDRMSGSQMIQS